jgi:ubiquinone/menaquinone biosynthesis C-methylase UbiE
MTAKAQFPDYEQIAVKLDLWMPHLSPVNEALLEHLPVYPAQRILDIACGTGEPGLTFARHTPKAVVIGVDSAFGMVSVANSKAKSEGLDNIKFLVMKAEKLDFPDNSFDGVLSRFGLMLLEDPRVGCCEILRVLKVGGRFAVAVWDESQKNTLFFSFAQAFNERVPPQHQLPVALGSRLAGSNVLPDLLQDCGTSQTATELFTFEMKFSNFQEIWTLVKDSGLFDTQLNLLAVHERLAVREHLENLLSRFKDNAGYCIPHCCRLAWGMR